MIGVGLDWFEPSFAVQVLAITLTPSFTGWLLVIRWAFQSDRALDVRAIARSAIALGGSAEFDHRARSR